jgi:DNA modification methylase
MRIASKKSARSGQVQKDGRRPTEAGLRNHPGATPLTEKTSPRSGLSWPVTIVPLNRLRTAARNARTHPKKQIEQIVKSIRQFGYVDPVLVDEHLRLIGGHARAEAAARVGLQKIPVVVVSGLSEAEKRALALADNKIAENAGWDRSELAVELSELAPLLADARLDIELTGFEPVEIDTLIGDFVDLEPDPLDELSEIAGEPVSRRRDLWLLGQHRLICGDATDPNDVRSLMGRERAVMVFADPTYHVKICNVQGRGRMEHCEFAKPSGEISRAQYTRFLIDALSLAARHSMDGSIHFVCTDWRDSRELQNAGERVYSETKDLIVWVKASNAGMGTLYRSQHELIFVFKNGTSKQVGNFELGQHGRSRTNVWNYRSSNELRTGRSENFSGPSTVKPVALIADAMRDCSRRGDIVLDPFMSSGTTMLAAERVGRRAYGLELDPLYVDAAIRRWQIFTGQNAIHNSTNQTFDELAASRKKIGGAR